MTCSQIGVQCIQINRKDVITRTLKKIRELRSGYTMLRLWLAHTRKIVRSNCWDMILFVLSMEHLSKIWICYNNFFIYLLSGHKDTHTSVYILESFVIGDYLHRTIQNSQQRYDILTLLNQLSPNHTYFTSEFLHKFLMNSPKRKKKNQMEMNKFWLNLAQNLYMNAWTLRS